ncbi:hypothetical protein BDAP_001518 [Binucleata daphniae]
MMLYYFFVLFINCKDKKKNQIKHNEPKRSLRQDYLTQIQLRCTRCGLYGDERNIRDAIISILPTKYKMSQGIVNKYFSNKLENNVQRYKKTTEGSESNDELFEDLSLLMPDITSETNLSIDASLIKKLNGSVMQINKTAVSAIFQIDEMLQESYITLSDQIDVYFDKSRNKLLVSILEYMNNSDDNIYIKVWGSIEKLIIDLDNVNVEFSAIFYFEITKKKEQIFREFVNILEKFFAIVKNTLNNLETKDQLDELNQHYNLAFSMSNFDNDLVSAIKHYFGNFFNNCKDVIKHLLQRFFELKGLTNDEAISDYISLEINDVEDEINSIICDGMVYLNDKVIHTVDEMIDKSKNVVKDTITQLITDV